GLGTGRYFVEFQPCNGQNLVSVFTTATVRAPRSTTGINGTLVPGGSIAGTVTTAGQSSVPVSFMCVDVLSSDPANPGGFAGTNTDGTYLATGLAAGSYTVLFDPTCGAVPVASQWYNNKSSQATADSVAVTVGQTAAGIDAALQSDGEITGTVQGPSATNVTGACVTAVPLDGQLPTPYVAVSKSGSYTLLQLPPGRYKVKFSSGCGATGYRTQWWQDAPTRQKAKVVRVSAGQTVPGISATLTP
ncbi:MAG TPA: carboxypeptidase-like regulatory domain-containing protein, partial [Streptosporangiaceae bacterium]|nr:carboxypeptidase-like regulatory domain-containing protein [Streptosporangiaceae bacterium]